MNIEKLEQTLKGLPTRGLCDRYITHYGHAPTSKNRPHLIKRILWAVQRDEFGDISDRARKKALAMADDRDIKTRFDQKRRPSPGTDGNPSKVISYQPQTDLLPGMVLRRNYQGRNIQVLVRDDGGFEWNGENFKSLSAVARAVTGTRWNGPAFFGLRKEGGAK